MIKRKSDTSLKPKKKNKLLSIIIFLVVCGAVGAGIGILSRTVFKNFFDAHINSDNRFIELLKVYGLVLVIFAGYLIHIIIHEAGHLIFGLMTGYSFISFRIGSFTLIKENEKLKSKRFNIPGTAGQCLMMPPALKDGKYPFVIYNYGGVIMNLIVVLLEILVVIFVEKVMFPIDAILVLTAAGGIFAALTNGIPMRLGGVPNDAYNVFSMLKDEEAKRGFYVQLKVNGLLSLGIRIKDMPLETFELKEDSDLYNPLITAVRLMEYSWYLDNMELENAKKCIASFIPYIDKLSLLFRYEINCERIFLELVGDCDKALIEDIYEKNLKKYIKAARFMISKKRFLMSYEGFYNEDKNKALEHYEAAKVLAGKYPIKGEADAELMIMDWIKERLHK